MKNIENLRAQLILVTKSHQELKKEKLLKRDQVASAQLTIINKRLRKMNKCIAQLKVEIDLHPDNKTKK